MRRSVLAVVVVVVMVCAAVVASLQLTPRGQQSISAISPADQTSVPSRGFYMGLLPTPAVNESFEQAYSQAKTIADLVPVWGRPSPFYNFASDLSGSWGDAFVTAYTRGNGMTPFVDMSFMGTNLTLAAPPGIANATLSNPAWRASYEAAALDVVKAIHPLFLSLGNEVNRWYEKYGASPGDPN